MFVDASAIVAMLTDETKARVLAGRLQHAANRITAPTAIAEAVEAVAGATGHGPEKTAAAVARFLELMGVRTVSLPAGLAPAAAEAMARFGRSPERPDGLTASQCLAYALARYYRSALLFDGAAFASTDIPAG